MDHGLKGKPLSQYKQLMKSYEQGDYLRCMKLCKSILSKAPNHSYTLATRALVHQACGRARECYDDARLSIRYDTCNFLGWHVLGVLFRSQHRHYEATKAFRMAFDINSENSLVRTDLAHSMLMIGDFVGYSKVVKAILDHDPSVPSAWMSMAIAYLLEENYSSAINTIDTFYHAKYPNDTGNLYDISQILLFKNFLLEKQGDIEGAVQHLIENYEKIADKQTWNEKLGEFHLLLNNKEIAKIHYNNLLRRNPDNMQYYIGLLKSYSVIDINCPPDEYEILPSCSDDLLSVLDGIRKLNPGENTPIHVLLTFLPPGETFKGVFVNYIRENISSRLDSLFNSFKYLYSSEEKVSIIELALKELKNELIGNDSSFEHLLSQHYSKTGDFELSIDLIEGCIEKDPTNILHHLERGKTLKRMGRKIEAALSVENAREIDKSDKYLNSKAVKYLLRADLLEEARKVKSIFTDMDPDGKYSYYRLEEIWYEQEEADCLIRCGHLFEALEQLKRIKEHFQTHKESQLSFHQHNYPLERKSLIAYYNFILYQKDLYNNKSYQKLCKSNLKLMLAFFDDYDKYSKEFEIHGFNTSSLLKEAQRNLDQIEKLPDLEISVFSFELYIRRRKLWLALKAICRISKENSDLARSKAFTLESVASSIIESEDLKIDFLSHLEKYL
eukprot:TRINITY_DN11604_c0_g1_i1.p1 TRINITY_DN11604_c0_g1~~TRINITY_DN11604_c0_g1_i1.p1  ORF type:complete len:671 (-),score=117.15 TRINITY_DN11604_c0_g1_i1:11-2023(-)